MNIIEEIKKEVYRRCSLPSNHFGMECYYHIEKVAYHSGELAGKYGVDKELCELAGWLHDIASITDFKLYPEHHVHGTKIAEALLTDYGYPKEKIETIKKCILTHRGSTNTQCNSLEERCVADADAISHFDNIPSLFYLVYSERKMNEAEGKEYVKGKLQRSFNKMSEESKEHYRMKKETVDCIFSFST